MKYLEQMRLGDRVECGNFAFDRDTIVAFAKRHDPQPFHLDEDAAKNSIFGRLTASGLHAASAGRALVLKAALWHLRFLGSPGALRMQMHRPVFPDMRVRVEHLITGIAPLAAVPGVGLVNGTMRGIDDTGEIVITIEDTAWIGSRNLAPDFDVSVLAMSELASPALGPLIATALMEQTPDSEPSDGRFFLEDCPVGATFVSREHVVTAEGAAAFHSGFDAPPLINEWHGPALAIPVMAETFWLRSANVGGTGLDMVRWPNKPCIGDRLRGKLRITHTRPLRSRPGLGLVRSECVLVNQRAEVLATFTVTTFLRSREAAISLQ